LTSSRAERLRTLPPLRAIFALAVPTTAVMALGATSGIVNTYFVARLGADAIAALSLVFPVNLILLTVMGGGIGTGVSAAVAQALGAGRRHDAELVAEHAFVLTMVLSVVLTAIFVGGAPVMFRWMGGRYRVLAEAVLYARVLFSGLGITFAVLTFDSILRGEGNVRVPSTWATVSLSLQILLVPVLMLGLGLGIGGAAAAVVLGQLAGAVPRAHFLFTGKATVRPRLLPSELHARPIRDILRVGVPASLSTLANYLGLLFLTAVVARYSTHDIAAFGLGTRLDFLILTLAYGIGSAVLTLVGFAAGAEDLSRVWQLLTRALVIVATMLLAIAIPLGWMPSLWLGIFTDDPAILAVGGRYLRILAPSYPFLGMSMACSFAFQGVGRAMFPLVLVVVRTAVVIAAALALVAAGAPVWSIFVVMALGNVASSLILVTRLALLLRAR
jgi:putative MATE family efflux protein